jgi:hypothetical protein
MIVGRVINRVRSAGADKRIAYAAV